MGCNFDQLGAVLFRKEDVKTFVEIYNEKMQDSLYTPEDDLLNESYFQKLGETYCMSYEGEPLFKWMDQGAPYEYMILSYLKAVPDAPFSAWYECTYNNCGAIDLKYFKYSDRVLEIETKHSEESELSYCDACDWDAYDDDEHTEPVCTAQDYDPDQKYACPKCNAPLSLDSFSVVRQTLKLVDGEWLDEKGEKYN